MPVKVTEDIDKSTEEKIIAAARKLFTEKGFAAVKTRDIAEAANINLALLNYYFRSKQKLFDIIMQENTDAFKIGISAVLSNEKDSLFVKIEKMVDYYINTLQANPNLALFIVNAVQNSHHDLFEEKNQMMSKSRQLFIKQFTQAVEEGKISAIHPGHFMLNILGLIVMPFLSKPVVKGRFKMSDKEFFNLMEERKKLIPVWIKIMLKAK